MTTAISCLLTVPVLRCADARVADGASTVSLLDAGVSGVAKCLSTLPDRVERLTGARPLYYTISAAAPAFYLDADGFVLAVATPRTTLDDELPAWYRKPVTLHFMRDEGPDLFVQLPLVVSGFEGGARLHMGVRPRDTGRGW